MHTSQAFLVTAVLLTSIPLAAQPLEFRPILQPGASIAGHLFTDDTAITNAALNDSGDIAFAAHWTEGTGLRTAVFTLKRIVVTEDDVIDGKHIDSIPQDGGIAINRSGQVAFESICRDKSEVGRPGLGDICILVDGRLAFSRPRLYGPLAFSLTDEGRIVLKQEAGSRVPSAQQKKQDLLDRVRIRPLRLPQGAQVDVAPKQTQQQRVAERPSLPPNSPFEAIAVNARGEVLIPVNLAPRGFLLLLGAPVAGVPIR